MESHDPGADAEDAVRLLGPVLGSELGVRPGARVLDFGCGAGALVEKLILRGYDARGCDVVQNWQAGNDRLSRIEKDPYRLPYADGTFDAVVSTSVLEHAQNKEEFFREMHRILRPGGYMFHLYPGKYFLPVEPHIYVPLISWMWPNVPSCWLGFWAFLGIRNEYQRKLAWREVRDRNREYCRTGLSYWTRSAYRRLVLSLFGNCRFPQDLYVRHAAGGAARLARRLPLQGLTSGILGMVRMTCLLARKD